MSRCPACVEGGGRVELAGIFRSCGARFREKHRLARCQLRAMRAIERCRTPALGGHRLQCDTCGSVRVVYNSCRNRHCPKCQTLAKERWLAARRQELLPVDYFHLVFTLPHELNSLAQAHPRILYDLLFHCASETLGCFASDRLGGEMGITAVLHTWGRNLSQHIHLHYLVTGGALSSDRQRWVAAGGHFLFPVQALSKVFRGKLLQQLRDHQARGELPAGSGEEEPGVFRALLRKLRGKDWVVYCKPPLAGPEQVLEYLARYTHRTALSNDRIVRFDGERVWFRWMDYRNGGRVKVMVLEAEEFIRRFLLHVLPDGYIRIRHYGLLANRARAGKLRLCRALMGLPPPSPKVKESVQETMLRLTGEDIEQCPVCGVGRLRSVLAIAPQAAVHSVAILDSS